MSKYMYCNNCGNGGHTFHQCKLPIMSNGVVAFRKRKNTIEYLMIRRKDTLGYVEFLRGKYSLYNKKYLQNIINEMTVKEKNNIVNIHFELLWNTLWGKNVGIQYRGEEKTSHDKFSNLKRGISSNDSCYSLETLVKDSTTDWSEPEWGFPKGRRNYKESDLSTALREFEEETGYDKNNLDMLVNVVPYEEIFTGSNYKSYKHKYFIGEINNSTQPEKKYQESEISKLQWFTYDEAVKHIRSYSYEKLKILENINTLLTTCSYV